MRCTHLKCLTLLETVSTSLPCFGTLFSCKQISVVGTALLIIYSTSLIILRDLNVPVDDISSPSTNKFLDILATHNLVQHVTSPTHQLGHTLDVVITRTEKTVSVLSVDPPLLSDHAFVVA